MRSAVFLRNIVCVCEEIFRVAVGPLHGDFDVDVFLRIHCNCLVGIKTVVMDFCFVSVNKIDKTAHTSGELENFVFSFS